MNKQKRINLIDLIISNNDFAKLSKFNKHDDLNNCNEKETYDLDSEISELRMHKILYFLYGYYYQKFNEELFEPNFFAWQYGPVEIDYRKNNKDSKFIIVINQKNNFLFLNNLIIKLLSFSTFRLIEESHTTDPWRENFSNNQKWKQIPKLEIAKFFNRK